MRMKSELENELNENKVQFARIRDKNLNFFLFLEPGSRSCRVTLHNICRYHLSCFSIYTMYV